MKNHVLDILCRTGCFLLLFALDANGTEMVPHHGQAVNSAGGYQYCLECHDGNMAPPAHQASHPVNIGYPPSKNSDQFAAAELLKEKGITLVNGKVSCISCHNLGNPERFHLSVKNSRSDLCSGCHLK